MILLKSAVACKRRRALFLKREVWKRRAGNERHIIDAFSSLRIQKSFLNFSKRKA
jgi:hypothetical protein